jgi:hypothetical protein
VPGLSDFSVQRKREPVSRGADKSSLFFRSPVAFSGGDEIGVAAEEGRAAIKGG